MHFELYSDVAVAKKSAIYTVTKQPFASKQRRYTFSPSTKIIAMELTRPWAEHSTYDPLLSVGML